MLINPGFECREGTYPLEAAQGGEMQIPVGWKVVFIDGSPWVYSTRMQVNGGACSEGGFVERIEGEDSLAVFAQDIEWSDKPGKPFDVAVYQQVEATPGQAYSLSGWLLSLCGGSKVPSDCPEGNYIAKLLGMDPTGGVDPLADSVIWVENRENFVGSQGERIGWQNLYTAAVAQADVLTVFARVTSPFQWHGNHALIDAFSLVEAPTAQLGALPAQVDDFRVDISWSGQQSPQIQAIPSGAYELTFDVQFRVGEEGAWQTWQERTPAGSASFVAKAANTPHFFRVRAFAAQPEGVPGAWPNHRYPGVWSEPVQVTFLQEPPEQPFNVFVPIVNR
ncbi:MAG: hypothetical protein D6790_16960 [Caldilineae bacterium]|nr:MAG: hypothetical protein D6790_16960 [Caldilineae bacterium]